MTLNELKAEVDSLVSLGFGDTQIIKQSDDEGNDYDYFHGVELSKAMKDDSYRCKMAPVHPDDIEMYQEEYEEDIANGCDVDPPEYFETIVAW